MNLMVTTWQQAVGTTLFFFLGGLAWGLGSWCAGWVVTGRLKK